jgi:hypothetical protein
MPVCPDYSREACNWRSPDRVQRNRGRAMMVGAGRMTATARADTGASEARREAWVRGCVQMCDEARQL